MAVSGSTRANSTNLNFIKAIAALAENSLEITLFEGLTDIPHFNPDLDNDHPPPEVAEFRNTLREADGILICTPEYAMGVPGTLKNALDWTVSSMEFSQKPVALITASSLGEKGHRSLLETLQVIEAKMTSETQLLISHAKTKINPGAVITDKLTSEAIQTLIRAFVKLLTTPS